MEIQRVLLPQTDPYSKGASYTSVVSGNNIVLLSSCGLEKQVNKAELATNSLSRKGKVTANRL